MDVELAGNAAVKVAAFHTKRAAEKIVDLLYPSLKPPVFAPPRFATGSGAAAAYPRLGDFAARGFAAAPKQVDPASSLPEKRQARKRQQILSLIRCIVPLILSRESREESLGSRAKCLVDFCGGAGHVGLLVAWLFPKWKVLCVDVNKRSLEMGENRAKELKLTNYEIRHVDVRAFKEPFGIGVALHACGYASDLVIDTCLKARADMVISPCCVGGIQNRYNRGGLSRKRLRREIARDRETASSSISPNPEKKSTPGDPRPQRPPGNARGVSENVPEARSRRFRVELSRESLEKRLASAVREDSNSKTSQVINSSFPVSLDPFIELARAADFNDVVTGSAGRWRRRAKRLVEADRMQFIRDTDSGLYVYLVKMEPLTASPKNDIIIASSSALSLHPHKQPLERSRDPSRSIESSECSSRSVGTTTTSPDVKQGKGLFEGALAQFPQELVKPTVERITAWLETLRRSPAQSPAATPAPAVRADDDAKCTHKSTQPKRHELYFKDLTGRCHRKVVHAVAESFGLGHRSVGDRRGKGRLVLVYKEEA